MRLVCNGRFAALLFCFLICIACGDVYRPTIIPNPVQPPDPKNFHSTFTVNQNGATNPGTGMQVDVSGDSSEGVTRVAMMPVHAALQGTHVWVANNLSDSVSVFTTAAGSSIPIGASTNVNLPQGARPVFVHSTETGTMYVANSGRFTDTSVTPPENYYIVDAINTTSDVISSEIRVTEGTPTALAEAPDGKKLYVISRDDPGATPPKQGGVTVISTVDETIVAALSAGASPRWAAVRSDGARVYVLSHDDGLVTTINSAAIPDAVIGSTAVGAGADFLYYDSRRNRLYIPNPTTNNVVILDVTVDPPATLATINLTAPIPAGGGAPCPASGCSPVSVAALPDGTRAYIASYYIDSTSANCQQTPCFQAQVTVVDELTNQVTKSIPLPQVSVSSMGNCASARFRVSAAVASDSSRVYVSSCDAGGVSSINPAGDQYFAAIPAPGSSFAPTLLNITGAVQNGSQTTYSYTYDPNSGTPIFLGLIVTITNLSQPADNGTFTVIGLGNGTFTVNNPSGQSTANENGTGLGQPPPQNPVFALSGS
jgi:DNA-binding beta-propeller fold protein YncE